MDVMTKPIKRVLYMGTPIPEDLEKIKKITKNDWEPDEWFIVPLRASDNLVSRNYKVWHDNVLEQMPQQLIGKSLIKNHDWDDVESATGFILDAFLVNDSLPEYNQDKMYKSLYNTQSKGYKCVYCIAAIHASKAQDIMDIKTMRISKCSTGGILSDVDIICPHCSAEYGREVSFFEIDEYGNYICPHQIPGGYDYGEDDELELADYAIWNGVFDGVELSLVVAGNLFQAEVVR